MKPRVLVIDDDDIVRADLADLLRYAGFETVELGSALGASRFIVKQRIDVVVLDVTMPDIDGDKAAQLLRSGKLGKNLGIILVSARNSDELRAMAAHVGADEVVSKEDVEGELALAVASAWNRRHAPDAASFG